MSPADTGRPRPAASGPLVGILLLVLSMWTLSCLDASGKWVMNAGVPLLVLSLAPWILKEPARMSRFVAAGIAFIGVIIVIRPGGGLHPVGTIFGLLTACCFAAQFIATRRVAGDDPFTSLIWSGAVGTACLTLALPFILPPALPVLQALTPLDWTLLISTGVTGGLGHLFQIAAYRRAPASTLAPFIYLQIISATTVGWLVWDHFPDPLTWLGIAIICASGIGIGLVEWRRGRARVAAAA